MKAYLSILIIMAALCFALSMMTGGWSVVKDLKSEHITKHAKFATAKISASMNSIHHMKLDEVLYAKQQVVSGMKYNMTIAMAPTECKKNHNITQLELENCPFLSCGAPIMCNITLWVQAWMTDGTKLLHSKCQQGEASC